MPRKKYYNVVYVVIKYYFILVVTHWIQVQKTKYKIIVVSYMVSVLFQTIFISVCYIAIKV
jgi:hypothetical protein